MTFVRDAKTTFILGVELAAFANTAGARRQLASAPTRSSLRPIKNGWPAP